MINVYYHILQKHGSTQNNDLDGPIVLLHKLNISFDIWLREMKSNILILEQKK